MPASRLEGGERQASRAGPNHKAQAPFPDVTGIAKTGRQTSDLHQKRCDPEQALQKRCAHCPNAASPRPGAAPDRIRHATYDSETDHRAPERTLGEIPAVPIARERDQMRSRCPVQPSLSELDK